MPPAAIGAQYSFTATVANGDGYAQWSADGLPSGLSLDPNTGVISGVPEVVGSTDVTLSAINDATLDYCTSADGAYCDEGSAMFSQNAQTHYHYAVVAYPTGG